MLMTRPQWLSVGALVVLGGGLVHWLQTQTPAEAQVAPAPKAPTVEQLQADLKKLQDLVPDQAAVMSHLSYHFANLWFAAKEDNWELADFYLGETRSNLKWAARVKPKRKDLQGNETVDIVAIAESIDNGPFTQLKKAIAAKDKPAFVK